MCLKGLNLIAHGSFFNRMVPNCFIKNGSNKHVFLLLHRLLPILSKQDNHLEEIVVNLSDVSLVYDQPETLLSEIKQFL
jgi:hypothetical protein